MSSQKIIKNYTLSVASSDSESEEHENSHVGQTYRPESESSTPKRRSGTTNLNLETKHNPGRRQSLSHADWLENKMKQSQKSAQIQEMQNKLNALAAENSKHTLNSRRKSFDIWVDEKNDLEKMKKLKIKEEQEMTQEKNLFKSKVRQIQTAIAFNKLLKRTDEHEIEEENKKIVQTRKESVIKIESIKKQKMTMLEKIKERKAKAKKELEHLEQLENAEHENEDPNHGRSSTSKDHFLKF